MARAKKTKEVTEDLIAPHKHAALMRLYAEDAEICATPWRFWEYLQGGAADTWSPCAGHPGWHLTSQYRRKPGFAEIRVFSKQLDAPLMRAPEDGTECYMPNLRLAAGFEVVKFDAAQHSELLRSGLLHASSHSAARHARGLTEVLYPWPAKFPQVAVAW